MNACVRAHSSSFPRAMDPDVPHSCKPKLLGARVGHSSYSATVAETTRRYRADRKRPGPVRGSRLSVRWIARRCAQAMLRAGFVRAWTPHKLDNREHRLSM